MFSNLTLYNMFKYSGYSIIIKVSSFVAIQIDNIYILGNIDRQ